MNLNKHHHRNSNNVLEFEDTVATYAALSAEKWSREGCLGQRK